MDLKLANKKMDLKIEKIQTIICARFVLHNFCERQDSVYINEGQVKTQLELLKANETQFKKLADQYFSALRVREKLFAKHERTALRKIFDYLHFTALVLYKSCIVKRFLRNTFFISNRFVSNWFSEVKVLNKFKTESSCVKQQQKSIVGNLCIIASKHL